MPPIIRGLTGRDSRLDAPPRRTKKNRRKVAFPPAKISSDRSAERSELVVHESAEDRRVVVDLRARIGVGEEERGGGVRVRQDFGTAEVGVKIFSADRDVVRDGVFDARADRPADASGTGAAAKKDAIVIVKGAEVRAAAAVSDTARSVNLQAIVGGDDEADLAARRSQPIQARL